jgi:hypothetical protein
MRCNVYVASSAGIREESGQLRLPSQIVIISSGICKQAYLEHDSSILDLHISRLHRMRDELRLKASTNKRILNLGDFACLA